MCSCGRGRSTQAIAVPIRPASLDESAATSSLASPIGCRHSCRDAQAASVQDGQKAAVPSRSVLMSYCAETNRGQGLEGSGGWLQVGSRWAGGQASEGLQRSCSTAASAGVVVFACLCLELYSFLCKQVWDGAHPCWDALTGLCVYIKSSSTMSNKARKLNLRHILHISNNVSIKLTSGPKRRINKVHGLHHAGTRVTAIDAALAHVTQLRNA